MSFTKLSAAALLFAGLATAAHAESDDNHASTTVLNALAGQRAVASEAYASVPGMTMHGTQAAYPQLDALPTQTNN